MSSPRAFPLWFVMALFCAGGYLWTWIDELMKASRRRKGAQ